MSKIRKSLLVRCWHEQERVRLNLEEFTLTILRLVPLPTFCICVQSISSSFTYYYYYLKAVSSQMENYVSYLYQTASTDVYSHLNLLSNYWPRSENIRKNRVHSLSCCNNVCNDALEYLQWKPHLYDWELRLHTLSPNTTIWKEIKNIFGIFGLLIYNNCPTRRLHVTGNLPLRYGVFGLLVLSIGHPAAHDISECGYVFGLRSLLFASVAAGGFAVFNDNWSHRYLEAFIVRSLGILLYRLNPVFGRRRKFRCSHTAGFAEWVHLQLAAMTPLRYQVGI